MRTPLLLAVLVLAACGDVGTAERLSSTETLDGIDVPTIGTVGDFPAPPHRLVVNIRADGTIVCEGRTLAFDALDARLAALDHGDGRPSPTAVVLRVDGGLAWGATSTAIMSCASHYVDQVWFAVRHEVDGVEGAIAACLPTDQGNEAVPKDRELYGAVEQRITVFGREGRSDATGAYVKVRESRAATRKDLLVTLDVESCVPTRTVIALLDASVRAGAQAVEFAMGATPRFDRIRAAFETAVAGGRVFASPEIRTKCVAESTEHDVPPGLGPMPPVNRIRGGPAGIAHPPKLDLPPITDAASR